MPPDATAPAAGSCARSTGTAVTVTVEPDVPQPRCVTVSPGQQLRVVNDSGAFGQHGSAVVVRWANYPARTLPVGAATAFDRPFGAYLAPGVHDLHVSLYGASSAEVWLR